MITFILKQYAGQIQSAIAHFITALVGAGIAWVLVKWPGFDSFCVTFIGQQPAAIAVSLSGSLVIAVNALLTGLANDPRFAVQDPLAAAILKTVGTARNLPESGTKTVAVAGATVTVKPAGAPTNEGKAP
jgi:hypothetical protein